jgi:hypothetical protein
VYDFLVYDTTRNPGRGCVGTSTATAEFAVDSLRRWRRTRDGRAYPEARKILIKTDAGGSNGYRRRPWKRELQRWTNADGREIAVSDYPSGASTFAARFMEAARYWI